jgi:hypothetical protein
MCPVQVFFFYRGEPGPLTGRGIEKERQQELVAARRRLQVALKAVCTDDVDAKNA